MQDSIISANPKKSIAQTDTKVPAIYNNAVHGTGELFHEDISRTGLDYYIRQQPIYEDDKTRHTQVDVYDIQTHAHVCRVHLPFVLTVALLYEHRYKIIRKAQSDKDVLLLRSLTFKKSFFKVTNLSGDPIITEYQIPEKNEIHNQYSNRNFDSPIYYQNKFYFFCYDRTAGHVKDGKETSLACYDCGEKSLFTYDGLDMNPQSRVSRALTVLPDDNLLAAYSQSDGRILLIDITTNTVKNSISMSPTDHTIIQLLPAGETPEVVAVTSVRMIACFDIHTAQRLAEIDLYDIIHQINPGENNRMTEDLVRWAAFSPDHAYGLVIFVTRYDKYMVLYDVDKKRIILQTDLIKNTGFPRYFENKLLILGFGLDAVSKIKKICRQTQTALPFYVLRQPFRYTSYLRNNKMACQLRDGYIRIFDIEKFNFSEGETGTEYDGISEMSFTECDGMLICLSKKGYSSLSPREVFISSYQMETGERVDVKEAYNRIKSYANADGDFKFPALRYDKKGTFNEKEMVTLDKDGKLKFLMPAENIVDLNEKYLVKSSDNRYKLYIYSRDNYPITTIILRQGFARVQLSEKPDCINVFYYGDFKVERYHIIKYAKGFYYPEAEYYLKDLTTFHFSRHQRESRDGRYMFSLYKGKEHNESRLYLYDTEENKTLYDGSLSHTGLYDGAEFGIIDPKMRFITLIDHHRILFAEPFTIRPLAELYLLSRGKFFIKSFVDGSESKYFYTNAPEMVRILDKDHTGNTMILETNDPKRREYLKLFNNAQKIRDIVLSPEKFKQEADNLDQRNVLAAYRSQHHLLTMPPTK